MIYRQLLEGAFDRLPPALQTLHSRPGTWRAQGTVEIQHHNSTLARLVRFPPSGVNVPVKLEVTIEENREIWRRRFGDIVRESEQRFHGGLLLERAGPAEITFRVTPSPSGICYEAVSSRVFGVPFPIRAHATEEGGESSWKFEVHIDRIGSYRGKMEFVR